MHFFYKLLTVVFWVGIATTTYSQQPVTTFNITYMGGLPPSCNPFSTASNFTQPWKSSHGSPNLADPFGQGFYSSVRLVGNWPVGAAKAKGEGVFIAYDFKADHLYTITTTYAHADGDDVGMDIIASNSVTEKSNSSCGEDELPATTGDFEIFSTNAIYNGPTGEVSDKVTDFNPNGKAYKYLWFRAQQYIYQASGALLIQQVIIEDKGINPNAPTTPPATPQCPTKSLTDPVANKITIPGASQRGFGISVAADGQYFVVGAYREGKAYVYKKVGCDVQLMATLSGNYYFGYSVDIDGDQIVVSEPPPTKGHGTVYLYKRYGEQWFLTDTQPMQIEQFGSSVAIEGNTVVVGSPYYTNTEGVICGRVIVYEIETEVLFPTQVFNGTVSFGGFGRSVDIKANSLVVGAPYNDNSAYLFNRDDNGVWNFANGWHATKKTENQDMGSNVALSEDGLHAFVGGGYVSGDDAAWVIMTFNKGADGVWMDAGNIANPWAGTPIGYRACAVGQNILITTAWESYVDVYRNVNQTRSRKTFIVQSGLPKDNFGASIAIGSDYFIIGAPEENPNCGYTGSVYLYDLFSMKDQTDHSICGVTYSGKIPDFGARTATIGATATCGNVTFQNGAQANYYANAITLKPGTAVQSGSAVTFQATGCLYGSNPVSTSRVAAIAEAPVVREQAPLVEEISETVVSVFPNPSPDGRISIQSTHGTIGTIEVYSPQGLLMDTIHPGESEGNTIDVDLPVDGHGVYIIKTMVNKTLYIQKVVR